MTLTDRLEKVAVLGAGGKMGSGISLLLAREMTVQMRQPENKGRTYRLTLVDVNAEALEGLRVYLEKQAGRFAEKSIDRLKPLYPAARSDEALKNAFVKDLIGILHPVTELAEVTEARLVFEAILEKLDLKIKVFSQLNEQLGADTYYLSNTSSIPIHQLEQKVGLTGRLIGFHFYNPPAVQKLVELIVPDNVTRDLVEISNELGKRLNKTVILSHDIAGFIGNGHFIRDGLHGIAEVERLQSQMSFNQAVYAINRVSQDFLIRPMGIFQLIDYVGLDVFQSIMKIMNPHFPNEHLSSSLIDQLVSRGVKGGQYSDGSQKDGFLKYADGRIAGVYDLESNAYEALQSATWAAAVDATLGPLPASHFPWKTLVKDALRTSKLDSYFRELAAADSSGARLAIDYLKRSKAIGELLISGGVAHSQIEVNGVLMNGFFHLYGPINTY